MPSLVPLIVAFHSWKKKNCASRKMWEYRNSKQTKKKQPNSPGRRRTVSSFQTSGQSLPEPGLKPPRRCTLLASWGQQSTAPASDSSQGHTWADRRRRPSTCLLRRYSERRRCDRWLRDHGEGRQPEGASWCDLQEGRERQVFKIFWPSTWSMIFCVVRKNIQSPGLLCSGCMWPLSHDLNKQAVVYHQSIWFIFSQYINNYIY